MDSRALAEIHDRHYPEIYRYALYRTDDADMAADIAGETFLRLLDALRAGRAPRAMLRGWLFGVARHLVDDQFRNPPALPPEDTGVAGGSAVDEDQVEASLKRQWTQAIIQALSDEEQQVLALWFGNGFSAEATAEVLGKSVAAVKALLFRAPWVEAGEDE